jgi:hypothetical protein
MLGRTMRYSLPLVLASFLLFPACGDKAANAANPADVTKNATDAAKNAAAMVGDATKQTAVLDKLKGTFTELTKSLGTITDGATAEKAKGGLETLVGTLKTQMGELGGLGKLADSVVTMKDGLMKPVMEQVTKLMGNADITKAIGPVLEQLKGLLGSK